MPMQVDNLEKEQEAEGMQCWWESAETGKPCALFVGTNVAWGSPWRDSMEIPHKIKNRTTIWFSNSTSGYTFEGNKITTSEYMCTPMLTAALFTKPRRGNNLGAREQVIRYWNMVYPRVFKATDLDGPCCSDLLFRSIIFFDCRSHVTLWSLIRVRFPGLFLCPELLWFS